MIPTAALAAAFLAVCAGAMAQDSLDSLVDGEIDSLTETFKTLHASPELSFQEKKTAAFVAAELRKLGYTVTEGVGRYERDGLTSYGLVGVLENGEGPTVLVRTDLDALPLTEKTDLPYASRVRARGAGGEEVGVMHACGHDLHMTVFLGTARLLAATRERWSGKLLLVGQPAEETGSGSKAMINDGLYERFGRPDFALALHAAAALEAGKVGHCEGYALASVNSVDITVRGLGGHGAFPSNTKDPVVAAAQIVMALQTIVSREVPAIDSAVVTVGSIHGGTKHNIIPDEVKLQLTVRAYRDEVRRQVLASIERIAKGVALAAGIPEDRAPIVTVREDESTPSTYNDPALTRRLAGVWTEVLGKERVVASDPVMGGEDFSRFSLAGGGVPACVFWLGVVDPKKAARSRSEGAALPSLHSPLFEVCPEPAIRTGVAAMTSAVLELMKK
jgi:hippurate hydrolase